MKYLEKLRTNCWKYYRNSEIIILKLFWVICYRKDYTKKYCKIFFTAFIVILAKIFQQVYANFTGTEENVGFSKIISDRFFLRTFRNFKKI